MTERYKDEVSRRVGIRRRKTPVVPNATGLRWTPPGYPSYSGYEQRTITNSNLSHVAAFESGRNCVFTIGEVITSPNVTIQGWNNVVIIGGEFNLAPMTAYSTYFRLFACTGTIHLEGIKADRLQVSVDAGLGVSTGPGSATQGATIQVENCRMLSRPNITVHNDVIQHWDRSSSWPVGYDGGARAYKIDTCTFLAGYQGTFFGNHSGPLGPDNSYISNTNYRWTEVNNPIYFWKTWRTDPWGYSSTFYFDNVYMENFINGKSVIPNQNGGGTTIAAADSPTRGYQLKSDADGAYLEWLSTSDMQGTIRFGNPPSGDFCAAGTPGMNYVSPGYQT